MKELLYKTQIHNLVLKYYITIQEKNVDNMAYTYYGIMLTSKTPDSFHTAEIKNIFPYKHDAAATLEYMYKHQVTPLGTRSFIEEYIGRYIKE